MKQIKVAGLLAVLSLTILSTNSCKKADIKFGEEFLDNGITQIYKTDSFSIDVSTVYLDSFVTSNRGNVLLGAYSDDLFGRVATQSYFELAPPSYTSSDLINTSFDSATLVLTLGTGNFYGDSTQPLNIVVDELEDSMKLRDNVYAFYNHDNFKVKATSKIQTIKSIGVRPSRDSVISIKLPHAFGEDLYDKMKNQNDKTLQTKAAFISYFKGIRLSTNTTSFILGCQNNPEIRLYYQQDAFPTKVSAHYSFPLTSKARQFNNISIDRGLGTANIKTLGAGNRVIPASASNNTAYLQASTGSMIKISFPSIKEALKLPNFAKVLKANLIIRPVENTYSTKYYLPPTLRLSQTDVNNALGFDLTYITNTGGYAVQLGLLQVDYYGGLKTQYQYDVTQYVKDLLNNSFITKGEGLLLTPPSTNFENQFARIAIGNHDNIKGKIELQLYYAAVK